MMRRSVRLRKAKLPSAAAHRDSGSCSHNVAMEKQLLRLLLAIGLFGCSVAAQKIEAPKLDPIPATPEQQQLIREGVALHDRGDYDGAISRYQAVIKENPGNVGALYEISFSYFQKKDFQKSLESAYQASKYKSDLLPQIYVQIGSCQDELGESKKAIETYQAAAKLFPSHYLIPFNLAITYNKLNASEDARAAAKRAAELNPNHASSQMLLAVLFDKGSYKTPGLLAVSRFLILEPKTTRSASALRLSRFTGLHRYRGRKGAGIRCGRPKVAGGPLRWRGCLFVHEISTAVESRSV